MKSSKLNQWLYFLSAFILLLHPLSSLSALCHHALFWPLRLSKFFFSIFLCSQSSSVCSSFLHTCLAQHLQYFMYCTLTGACNVRFNNRMPPLSHGLKLTISFHTFHHLNFESLCAFLSFLALGILFSSCSSLGISVELGLGHPFWHFGIWGILTWFGACDTACTCMYNLVSGERVSDLYNDIWVCNCIFRPGVIWNYLFPWWLQMQEGGATSHTTQEQMHIFRRKGQATFAKLHRHFPLPAGLIWSPAKAMVRHRVWEILLQLEDAALTRHSRHRTYCSGFGPLQPCKQRSLSENSKFFLTTVFFLSILSFQFLDVFHA